MKRERLSKKLNSMQIVKKMKIILSILFLFCSYLSIAQEKEIKAVLEKQRLD
jgi:hypothetical protein